MCVKDFIKNGTMLKESVYAIERNSRRGMHGCNNGFNKSPIAKTDVVADIVAALGQLTNGAVDERVSIIALIASMIDHR